MDAVKFIKEKERMCGRGCEISLFTECVGCDHWIEQYPEEAVRIVEEWSKAHPVQTRREKFKEVFGKDACNVVCNLSCTCVGYSENCTDCAITAWWDEPYEAPKGAE